jgi:integrase
MTKKLDQARKKFVKWCKVNLETTPTPKTLQVKSAILRTLVLKHGLDLDNPNPDEVLENIADTSAKTQTTYRTILKQWLLSKGLSIAKDDERFKYKKGQNARTLQSKDLIVYEEMLNIVEHTQSPMLRAYYLALWDTAARPSGLARLNVSDVAQDKHGFVFHIIKAKNVQSRRSVRLLDPVAIKQFGYWWSVHPKRDDPEAPLFLNKMGNRLNVKVAFISLSRGHNERLGRGNGNGKAGLSLYLIRKSRLTQLLREKKLDETDIRLRAGHKRHSRMLEQYYDLRDAEDHAKAELEYLGAEEKTIEIRPEICPSCFAENPPEGFRCVNCHQPMNETAMIEQQEQDKRIRGLEDKLDAAIGVFEKMGFFFSPEQSREERTDEMQELLDARLKEIKKLEKKRARGPTKKELKEMEKREREMLKLLKEKFEKDGED